MKTYCVLYNVTTSHDAVVKAKNMEKAKAMVTEVIGEPLEIEAIYEVKKNERT